MRDESTWALSEHVVEMRWPCSGADNCNLLVATLNKLCVKLENIIGSDESEELSSLVNEGEGEGGGVVEPDTPPSTL